MRFYLFSSLVLVVSSFWINFTVSYSKIARTFFGYGKGVAESCVINFTEKGERIVPRFDKKKLERKTNDYFRASLSKKDYVFSFEYYPHENAGTITSFSLHFEGRVCFFLTFKEETKFMIDKGL